jgi:ribose transport system permease protein
MNQSANQPNSTSWQTRPEPPFWRRFLAALDSHEALLVGIILAAGTAMTLLSSNFLTWTNISGVLLGLAVESIVAIGMTILLVSGGFDLSVGSSMALSGALAAMALVAGLPLAAALLVGLAVGAAIGLANGVIVAYVRINPFITTLGTLCIGRGLLYVLTGQRNIADLPRSFTVIGQGDLFGIQYPILISVVLVVLFDLLLRRSKFLRQNYYIGGNEKAAFLCGIPVERMKVFNYVLTGLLAAVAGLVSTARFGSSSLTAGVGLELKVITAVVIGGASLSGGEGTILGAFLGSCLMGLITDALTLLGVESQWNTLVIGSALLMAVLMDTFNKRRKGLL